MSKYRGVWIAVLLSLEDVTVTGDVTIKYSADVENAEDYQAGLSCISYTSIPEPSMATLGLLGLGTLLLRRRRV